MAQSKEAVSAVGLEETRGHLECQGSVNVAEHLANKEERLVHKECWKYQESPPYEKSLFTSANEALHDIAVITKEFAYEVAEKIVGHITDHDISKATKHLNELKDQLAYEQQFQRDALVAEKTIGLGDYDDLKEEEIKAKKAESAMEWKIEEATARLELLLNERRLQQLHQRYHEGEHPSANLVQHQTSVITPPPMITPPHSPKARSQPIAVPITVVLR